MPLALVGDSVIADIAFRVNLKSKRVASLGLHKKSGWISLYVR